MSTVSHKIKLPVIAEDYPVEVDEVLTATLRLTFLEQRTLGRRPSSDVATFAEDENF